MEDNIKHDEATRCYTYEVTMLVQVLAEDAVVAEAKLDSQGGHISYRKVELRDSVPLFTLAAEEVTQEDED
jgi:hypothetical protein